MKFSRYHLIVLGIGLVFILMGVLQGVFGLKMSKQLTDQISFVLMMVAAYILFKGRAKRNKEQAEEQEKLESDADKSDGQVAAEDESALSDNPEQQIKDDSRTDK